MSRAVIMIAYHFPPEEVIGAARSARFYKYLSRLSIRCMVVTAADPCGKAYPDVAFVPDTFESHRGGIRWHLERMVRRVLVPGHVGLGWAFHVAEAAQRLIRENPEESFLVYSSFPPLGVSLAAWLVAHKNRIPWVADLRDPLTGNPAVPNTAFSRMLYRQIDNVVFRSATAIIANTDSAAEAYRARFPDCEAKIKVIWNGFDPENRIQPLPIPPRPYRILSHSGELYRGRTVKPLLESAARLVQSRRLQATGFRISLVGPIRAESLPSPQFVEQAQRDGWLQLGKAVSMAEARNLAATSDGLLLVQPHSSVQVPGKLFEYLQIGRPIFAFIARNSPSERILTKSGVPFRCVYPDSSPDAYDQALADFFTLPTEPVRLSNWAEHEFDARHQAETLKRIIDGL